VHSYIQNLFASQNPSHNCGWLSYN